jgi:hypothetical protein
MLFDQECAGFTVMSATRPVICLLLMSLLRKAVDSACAAPTRTIDNSELVKQKLCQLSTQLVIFIQPTMVCVDRYLTNDVADARG